MKPYKAGQALEQAGVNSFQFVVAQLEYLCQ